LLSFFFFSDFKPGRRIVRVAFPPANADQTSFCQMSDPIDIDKSPLFFT
jgi:hypothetical protein